MILVQRTKTMEINDKENGLIKRLTNKTFKFDKRFMDGYYSANYFIKTRKIVLEHLQGHIAKMQFFQRSDDVMACGLDECIALLQEFSSNPEDLEIEALNDGDIVKSGEPVLKIKGRYEDFGFLESAIDGILSRRSSVATNCYRVLKVTNGKPVLNMGDRQDDPYTQSGDGYASYVAGMRLFSTDAQGAWVGILGGGTMPHALIELCDGDVNKAADYFYETFSGKPITVLIDYRNNAVWDSVALARHLGDNLGAVRVDTSKALIDHYFDDKMDEYEGKDIHGVNIYQIKALREELDKAGYPFVKIVVSSGFDEKKIKFFEDNGAPVDIYGVGTSLLKIFVGYTGDLVELDGKPQAKEGRSDIPSSRLEKVKLNKRF